MNFSSALIVHAIIFADQDSLRPLPFLSTSDMLSAEVSTGVNLARGDDSLVFFFFHQKVKS